MTGFIRRGHELTADVVEAPDVCIIGSGAGGAVTAARLAAEGLDVVILEYGGWFTNQEFSLDEAVAFPQLYMGRGAWSTKDAAITILQGRSVGGSTTINWTTSYRTPERILAHWRDRHGSTLDEATLRPHWDAVDQRLNISEWPEDLANANNQVLFRGCRELGWQVHHLRRNVKGCLNSGYCGLGCPVNAKQAMGITYVADAVAAGARVYANVHVDRLVRDGDRISAIEGTVLQQDNENPTGVKVRITPRVTVLSAGAIGSPGILLRSGIDPNGQAGKRTWIHPVGGIPAIFDEPINGFHGAPQSAASHEFIDRGAGKIGFFLEAPPVQPLLISGAHSLIGEQQADFMTKLPHVAIVIALAIDGLLDSEQGGTVGLKGGGVPTLDYDVGPALQETLAASTRAMARIVLAAGAREAMFMHATGPVRLTSEADLHKLDGLSYGALQHPMFTAHVMGGCAMGSDPASSVVDPNLRHHHVENLFVVDGSVLPTSLGVNPSVTIYGIAHWAADAVAAAV